MRGWRLVHSWTSLACTGFLLMLCLTGLPLIFQEEIDRWTGAAIEVPALPAGTPHAVPSRVLQAGLDAYPGLVAQFMVWPEDEPDIVLLNLAARRPAPRGTQRIVAVDARTAEVLGEKRIYEGVMRAIHTLHADMFLGLPGRLFLGLMGLLLLAALVSGTVLYGPVMRRMAFGTIRRERRRIRWLDLHNLIGIVTLAWAFVVGATGVVNTWTELAVGLWQRDQVAAMTAPYRHLPPPGSLASMDDIVAAARAAAPGMAPAFLAFPGMPSAGPRHFMVALRGESAVARRLLKPVLVDAGTARLVGAGDLPWYMTAILLAQPLHFGDYGGLPLKILWALFDLATIAVLVTGLYLWAARRRAEHRGRSAGLEAVP